TLFRKGNMADPFIIIRAYVIEVGQVLISGKCTENIHVAISIFIFGKNVVVRYDDELFLIPYTGILTKLVLNNADRGRSASIVRHEYIYFLPYSFGGLRGVFSAVIC